MTKVVREISTSDLLDMVSDEQREALNQVACEAWNEIIMAASKNGKVKNDVWMATTSFFLASFLRGATYTYGEFMVSQMFISVGQIMATWQEDGQLKESDHAHDVDEEGLLTLLNTKQGKRPI